MPRWLLRRLLKEKDPASPEARALVCAFAGWVGVVCNALLAAAKFVVGLAAGSVSVVADAFNNLSDLFSSLVTLAGFKLAGRRADREHPFGHGRYEYIAALSVAVLIVAVGVELGRDAVARLITPSPVSFTPLALALLGVSVLLKAALGLFYKSLGRAYGAHALTAAGVDSFSDVVATLAVLLGAALSRFVGVNLDGWLGLAVAVFIAVSGVGLVRRSLSPLLGESPDPDLVRRLTETIESHGDVLSMHDLIVHDYGPQRRFASAHVEISGAMTAQEAHDVLDAVEREVFEKEGVLLILHSDPVSADDVLDAARRRVRECVRSVDPRLSVHDVRVDPTGATCYFDVSVPPECEIPDGELKERIERAVAAASPESVRAVIHIDRFYTTY